MAADPQSRKSDPDTTAPAGAGEGAPPEAGGHPVEGWWERFEQAHQRFNTGLEEAWRQAHEAHAERHRQYVLACHEAHLDAQAKAAEAYRTYSRSLHELWGRPAGQEAQQEAADAQRVYLESVQEAQAEAQRRAGEALQGFAASAEGPESFTAVYHQYLGDLRGLWEEMDVDAVDPILLSAIARNLGAAAWSAQSVLAPAR